MHAHRPRAGGVISGVQTQGARRPRGQHLAHMMGITGLELAWWTFAITVFPDGASAVCAAFQESPVTAGVDALADPAACVARTARK